MLISKSVEVKWNSANKKRYVSLGYNFTKMGDQFIVNINDLSKGSHSIIIVKCDYCGKIIERKYKSYISRKNSTIIEDDACGECQPIKSYEGFVKKYGITPGEMLTSEKIQGKVKQSIKDKYGVDNIIHIPFAIEKMQTTRDRLYGREYFSELMSGENNPMWNGGITSELRVLRNTYEYRDWRKEVLENYNNICQCCGTIENLEVHHILGFAEYPDSRYEIKNGIILCVDCHKEFHDTYGYKGFNNEDLKYYIADYKAV